MADTIETTDVNLMNAFVGRMTTHLRETTDAMILAQAERDVANDRVRELSGKLESLKLQLLMYSDVTQAEPTEDVQFELLDEQTAPV